MKVSRSLAGRVCALLAILTASSPTVTAIAKRPGRPPPPPSTGCDLGGVTQPKYAIFLDDYPTGHFQLIELPCLDSQPDGFATPRELALDLPKNQRRKFQIANGDVFFDGIRYRFVFGGRTDPSDHWGIWGGVLDIGGGKITNIHPIVRTPGVREEDPRFSSDGQWIVYKSDGQIWLTPLGGNWGDPSAYAPPILFEAENDCELWAPSMYANVVSYARRCNGDEQSDRIVYHPLGDNRVILESEGGGPDRFAHFTRDGYLVYSHVDLTTGRASLWRYIPSGAYVNPELLLDWTPSDDDAFADRQFSDYIAFSGWSGDGYDLYVTRQSIPNVAVQLTDGINVLGTITFGYGETSR
jgi:WD40-like Beta Propeller Repeat